MLLITLLSFSTSCSIYKTEAKKFFEENGVAYFLGEFDATSLEKVSNTHCTTLQKYELINAYHLNHGKACLWENESKNQLLCMYETTLQKSDVFSFINLDLPKESEFEFIQLQSDLYFWQQSKGISNYLLFDPDKSSETFCVFSSNVQSSEDPDAFLNPKSMDQIKALY